MEEGDGSVSGSSPLSDASQSDLTRRLLPKQGKWKLFGVASPESTSRGSSKTGQDSPEPGETGKILFSSLVNLNCLCLSVYLCQIIWKQRCLREDGEFLNRVEKCLGKDNSSKNPPKR